MKKTFFYIVGAGIGSFLAVCAGIAGAFHAQAADLVVLPAVIDESAVPNDILNYTLTVTNTTGNLENVFASVYELTPSGTEPFADPSASNRPELLADWIDVPRAAMTFAPGESKTIPVTIQINPYATAGDYHAVIAFVEGGTRPDAEEHLDGAPQTLVDMSVISDLTANLQVAGFSAAKGFYSSFPVAFSYTVENNGDVSSTPSGEIMFYDRLGREIGSVDANPDDVGINPGGKKSFTAQWLNGGGFGQYKAVLDLTYGANNDKLENTALVWVLPWEKLAIIFGSLFAFMMIAAIWLHRVYEKRHYRRQQAIENIMNRKKEAVMEPILDLRHPHE